MKDVRIYNIIYSQEHPCEHMCYDNSQIRTVEQKSYLFEWNPIIDIVDNHLDSFSENYLGIFSWKFSLKTGIFRKKLEWILDKNPNYDVYNFCRPLRYPYLFFTEQVHPGFLKRFTVILNHLDIPYCEPKTVVYSNFFLCKKEIYKDFVDNWIKTSIDLMENDEEFKQLCFEKCDYKGLPPEKLKEFTGLEYYPWMTFLLERLFSFYLEQHQELKIWNNS